MTLVAGTDGAPPRIVGPATWPTELCPACTERLGIETHARLTIEPTRARRDPAGKLILDEVRMVCAQCQKQGVITRF